MIQPWTQGHSTEGGDAVGESQPSAEYSNDQHLRDTMRKKAIKRFFRPVMHRKVCGKFDTTNIVWHN